MTGLSNVCVKDVYVKDVCMKDVCVFTCSNQIMCVCLWVAVSWLGMCVCMLSIRITKTLHNNSTTYQKQHNCKRFEPNDTTSTHVVALDMSKAFDTVKHSHTHRKAVTNKHPTHLHQMHCKQHQRMQSLHIQNIQKPQIHNTPNQTCLAQGGVLW